MQSVFRDYLIAREKDLIKARSVQGLEPSQIPEDLKAFDEIPDLAARGGAIGACKCKPCAYCRRHKVETISAVPIHTQLEAVAPAVVQAVEAIVEVAKQKRAPSAKQLEWRALVSAVMRENPGMKMSEASKLAKARRA